MWSISQCGDTFCTQVNCVFLQGNALKVSFYNSFAFQCYWFFSSKIVPSCHALQWKCTKEAIHDKKRRKEVFCAISKVQKRRSHSEEAFGKLFIWCVQLCVRVCTFVCVCVCTVVCVCVCVCTFVCVCVCVCVYSCVVCVCVCACAQSPYLLHTFIVQLELFLLFELCRVCGKTFD